MSRIGKKPISVPAAVKINHNSSDNIVAVEGPKGKMSYTYMPVVNVEWKEDDREIVCSIPDDRMKEGQSRAHWGTTRSRIEGMVTGVTDGYTIKLEINGVGWNAKDMGKMLQLNLGYNAPIDMPKPDGVEASVENNIVTITGYDKQAVGQYAAEIRSKRPPEPYNGKGVKYIDEVIIRKQGKAFGA